jgi:hypothetical protein
MLSLRDDPTPEAMIEVTVIGGVIEFASSFTSVEHDIKSLRADPHRSASKMQRLDRHLQGCDKDDKKA